MWSKKRKLGNIGEDATCNHLRRKGYSIVERNYLKKWGEIDIIAVKNGIAHFIEVKTVSREIPKEGGANVAREIWRPEENVHAHKLRKLQRAIDTWLSEREWEADWQIDVAIVVLDQENRRGTVKIIENIV